MALFGKKKGNTPEQKDPETLITKEQIHQDAFGEGVYFYEMVGTAKPRLTKPSPALEHLTKRVKDLSLLPREERVEVYRAMSQLDEMLDTGSNTYIGALIQHDKDFVLLQTSTILRNTKGKGLEIVVDSLGFDDATKKDLLTQLHNERGVPLQDLKEVLTTDGQSISSLIEQEKAQVKAPKQAETPTISTKTNAVSASIEEVKPGEKPEKTPNTNVQASNAAIIGGWRAEDQLDKKFAKKFPSNAYEAAQQQARTLQTIERHIQGQDKDGKTSNLSPEKLSKEINDRLLGGLQNIKASNSDGKTLLDIALGQQPVNLNIIQVLGQHNIPAAGQDMKNQPKEIQAAYRDGQEFRALGELVSAFRIGDVKAAKNAIETIKTEGYDINRPTSGFSGEAKRPAFHAIGFASGKSGLSSKETKKNMETIADMITGIKGFDLHASADKDSLPDKENPALRVTDLPKNKFYDQTKKLNKIEEKELKSARKEMDTVLKDAGVSRTHRKLMHFMVNKADVAKEVTQSANDTNIDIKDMALEIIKSFNKTNSGKNDISYVTTDDVNEVKEKYQPKANIKDFELEEKDFKTLEKALGGLQGMKKTESKKDTPKNQEGKRWTKRIEEEGNKTTTKGSSLG